MKIKEDAGLLIDEKCSEARDSSRLLPYVCSDDQDEPLPKIIISQRMILH